MVLQWNFSWRSNYLKKKKRERKKKEFSLAANFPEARSVLARIHKGIFQANLTELFH